MSQRQVMQRFVMFSLTVACLAPLSLFADERPEWRTQSDLRAQGYERRGGYDVEGVVVSVDRNSNDFRLRTGRGTVEIQGRYAVPVYFQGRRYRINDLERGDRVAVDLQSSWFGGYRARSVTVLSSVSHRGYGRGGRYGDSRDDRYRDDRYRDDRYNRDRYQRLYGRIESLDRRGDSFVVRTGGSQRVRVESRGRNVRSLREGDYVEIEGYYNGREFVAERISTNRRSR